MVPAFKGLPAECFVSPSNGISPSSRLREEEEEEEDDEEEEEREQAGSNSLATKWVQMISFT